MELDFTSLNIFFNFIELWLVYNVGLFLLCSGMTHSVVCVCVCVCVCIPSHILFHYSLLQDSVYDSVRQCICKLDEPCQTVVHEIMVPLAAL